MNRLGSKARETQILLDRPLAYDSGGYPWVRHESASISSRARRFARSTWSCAFQKLQGCLAHNNINYRGISLCAAAFSTCSRTHCRSLSLSLDLPLALPFPLAMRLACKRRCQQGAAWQPAPASGQLLQIKPCR